MSSYWQIGGSETKDAEPSPLQEKALTQDDAEAILAGLASTYAKDIAGSLGTLHHFFERLDQKPLAEGQLPKALCVLLLLRQ